MRELLYFVVNFVCIYGALALVVPFIMYNGWEEHIRRVVWEEKV